MRRRRARCAGFLSSLFPLFPPRHFSYFFSQGEDPWLASKMVASEIWGIQSQNVSGCIKHYVFK